MTDEDLDCDFHQDPSLNRLLVAVTGAQQRRWCLTHRQDGRHGGTSFTCPHLRNLPFKKERSLLILPHPQECFIAKQLSL